MSVFQINQNNTHLKKKMFLDDPVSIARFDIVKYPFLEKLTEKQLSFFWRPEEIDISRDSKDFRNLNDHEKHIFTSNLKRQILLDSIQGRSPNIAFLPICSLPELENWIVAWAFSETIHSRSYTHIIRNIYSDPSKIFDEILDIQEIVDCAKDISKHYDELILNNTARSYDPNTKYFNDYSQKKALYLALMSVNILEGIRFYASFACSWNFAETKRMEGNAKIIKLICRDENLHLAGTQQILKNLLTDDPEFVTIAQEEYQTCVDMFISATEQEKAWSNYLFKDGSMLGLNETLLNQYLEWLCNKRMVAVGLKPHYKVGRDNPLPWTQSWIAGSDVQVAPQEVEVSSYTTGDIKNDISTDTFKGFTL